MLNPKPGGHYGIEVNTYHRARRGIEGQRALEF